MRVHLEDEAQSSYFNQTVLLKAPLLHPTKKYKPVQQQHSTVSNMFLLLNMLNRSQVKSRRS